MSNDNNTSNNNNMMNNNNDDHGSFLGYKPPTDEVPNPPRPDEIIQVKQHKYRIIRSIGEGGSGKVYQVLSLTYMDIFALKWIILRDDIDKKNVLNEIKIMKELMSSRHVINLCDSEITEKVAYMVMEYGSLNFGHLIQSQIKEGWDIMFFGYYWKQMLKAVEATHQHNIIHADLKPANFVVVGTANFMAPETFVDTGEQSGYRQGRPSDVWSLGCILYQMIYSKPPFFHLPRDARIGAITNVNHDILIPENVKYGNATIAVPTILRNLLHLCLNRDVKLRPTLRELLAHPFVNTIPCT
ncbi:hypothetical protein HPULCUR_004252 [Helicostylum pulchrum]|uniref:Protein kinase domain-containing protein n=1 Tax=Helicostylum pulchrum TaxID=562976 RepID=A0ABP9XVP3_9FUNG